MRAPHIDPATAGAVLALVAAAQAHAPGEPLGWLVGYCARASGEPIDPPPSSDPRREPSSHPPGMPLARVALTRRMA